MNLGTKSPSWIFGTKKLGRKVGQIDQETVQVNRIILLLYAEKIQIVYCKYGCTNL